MLFTSGLSYFFHLIFINTYDSFCSVIFTKIPAPICRLKTKSIRRDKKTGGWKEQEKVNISTISETLSGMSDSPLQSDLETVVFLNMADEVTAQVDKQAFLPAEYGEVNVSIKWMGFGAMCKSLIKWYLYINSKFDLVSNEAEKDARS